MKKISIVLLAVFFIGIANVNAQTDAPTVTDVTNENVVGMEEVKDVKTCAKTGKACDATCENKKNGTCCKGEKKKSCSKSKSSCSKSKSSCSKSKSSCSKSNESSFNFDKSNDYADEKSSCSKKAKKGCCKKEATATSIK